MEDWATPWLIADATNTSDKSLLWAWATLLVGVAIVLAGGVLGCAF